MGKEGTLHTRFGPCAPIPYTADVVSPCPPLESNPMGLPWPIAVMSPYELQEAKQNPINNIPSYEKATLPLQAKEMIFEEREVRLMTYLETLNHHDSILSDTQKRIEGILSRHPGLSEPKVDQQSLFLMVVTRKATIRRYLLLSTLLVFLLSYFHIKYRITKAKLASAKHQGTELPKHDPGKKIGASHGEMAPALVQRIENALHLWENRHGYLEKGLSQHKLAETLKTNTSYLSNIINTYKGQTFSNYIKGLRVTYAVNHLKENPQLVQTHSTIQIAELFGFNSQDVFTRALKAKIGMTPKVFFKKLALRADGVNSGVSPKHHTSRPMGR